MREEAILMPATFVINSLTHVFGWRRYATADTSRNSFILAVVTMGEGWHNNHHHYKRSTNQGFYWWELDVTYYLLRCLSWLGLVWSLRTPPREVRDGATAKCSRGSYDHDQHAALFCR